ncbi:MAG: hypothetical protein H0T79_20330 [Deltaproteobacteria bacterium]|nr:hypothetical protein [Deltaproteobacteria bacterium]
MPGTEREEDRERAAREIALAVKRLRRPLPRGLWILALVIGLGCTIAAAVAWTSAGGPVRERTPAAIDRGPRFGMGIGIGLGAGLVIGFALGRRRRSPDHPTHSSTSSP